MMPAGLHLNLGLWLILIPAAGLVVTLATARWSTLRHTLGIVLAIAQFVCAATLLTLFDTPPPSGATAGPVTIAQLGDEVGWVSSLEPASVLAVDGLNLYGLVLLAAVTVLALVVSVLDGPARASLRQAGVFAVSASAAGFLLSRDLLLAAGFHAATALSLAAVLHLGGALRPRRPAATRFLWPALLASAALWLAALWCQAAGDTGSVAVDALVAARIPGGAIVLLILFLALHLPLVPLHRWLSHGCAPDGSYSGIGLAGGVWTMLGVVAWLRLGLPLSATWLVDVTTALTLWGVITAIIALLAAAGETTFGARARWVSIAFGGLIAMALADLRVAAVTGAVLIAVATGLPRAGALVFGAWLRPGFGGVAASAWTAGLALALAGVAGMGAFAGWLSVLSSTAGWLLWSAVAALTLTTGLLLASAVTMRERRVVRAMPLPLRLVLASILAIAFVSGWQPALLSDWIAPDVERVLAAAPSDDVPDALDPAEGVAGGASDVDEAPVEDEEEAR